MYAFSPTAGGLLDPATTFAFGLTGKLPWVIVWSSQIFQWTGGVLGTYLVEQAVGQQVLIRPKTSFTMTDAVVIEFVFSAILCFTGLIVQAGFRETPKNDYYAIAVGFLYVGGGHASSEVSGALLNPAVTIGYFAMGLLRGDILTVKYAFYYILAQAAGGLFAAYVYFLLKPRSDKAGLNFKEAFLRLLRREDGKTLVFTNKLDAAEFKRLDHYVSLDMCCPCLSRYINDVRDRVDQRLSDGGVDGDEEEQLGAEEQEQSDVPEEESSDEADDAEAQNDAEEQEHPSETTPLTGPPSRRRGILARLPSLPQIARRKNDLAHVPLFQRCLCEFLGTFMVCFVFTMTRTLSFSALINSVISPDTVGYATGMTSVALSFALMDFSGAHFNPAVTLGLVLAEAKFEGWHVSFEKGVWTEAAFIMLSQVFAGAVCAFYLVPAFPMDLGGNTQTMEYSFCETIFTMGFVFVMLGVRSIHATHRSKKERKKDLKKHATHSFEDGLALDLGFGAGLTAVSDACMNPAISVSVSIANLLTYSSWTHGLHMPKMPPLHAAEHAWYTLLLLVVFQFMGTLLGVAAFLLTHPHDYKEGYKAEFPDFKTL